MEEELKREYKLNKRFVFLRILQQKFMEFFLILFGTMFLDTSFDIGILNFIWYHKDYWQWIIFLGFISFIIDYNNKIKFFHRESQIDHITLYRQNPKANLEVRLERCQTRLDIIKNNTDILKTFSPIPIVIFVAGLFFQDKIKDNLYESIGLIVSVCLYIVQVYRLSKKFKECRRIIERYKLAIHNIENPDLYVEKPRESIYKN